MENTPQKQSPIWTTLWLHPRQAIAKQIETAPKRLILWLAIVHGALSGLYFVPTFSTFFPSTAASLLYGYSVCIGMIIGIVQLYLISWLYMMCGHWIGGKGTYTQVKCAAAWSLYPFILAGIVGYLTPIAMPILWLQSMLSLLSMVLFLWGLVILFHVLAQAHAFSVWRGVATVVLALLLLFGLVYILAFVQTLIF